MTAPATGPVDQSPTGPAVTMYSTQWCGYCHRLKSQLDSEGIAYDIVDIERYPEAAQIVESANDGNQTVPTLVYRDGTAQTNPSLAQVKQKLASLDDVLAS
jgi:mycoredoxin